MHLAYSLPELFGAQRVREILNAIVWERLGLGEAPREPCRRALPFDPAAASRIVYREFHEITSDTNFRASFERSFVPDCGSCAGRGGRATGQQLQLLVQSERGFLLIHGWICAGEVAIAGRSSRSDDLADQLRASLCDGRGAECLRL